MPIDRRQFMLAAGAAAAVHLPSLGAAVAPRRFKAIAFDAFPIFDPRPVFALAEALFQGKGAQLGNAWRTKQFEYQWLRALSGRYADFWQATGDALVFAARLLDLELTPQKRERLMQAYLELDIWPDVEAAIRTLREAGLRLALLSNMTPGMLAAGVRNAGLDGTFEHVLSTDRIRTFKPDPRAYQLGIDAFGLEKQEILFVAFAGWDAAGAKGFGYPTFWVNRLGAPEEELGVAPDGTGRSMADLASFALARR